MRRVQFRFIHDDDQIKYVIEYMNDYPLIGDIIHYKDKCFEVTKRYFNLNNEDHNTVYAKEISKP